MLVGSIIGGEFTILIIFYNLVIEPQLKALDKKILALEVRTDEHSKDIKGLEKSTIKIEENFRMVISALNELKDNFKEFLKEERQKERERFKDQEP